VVLSADSLRMSLLEIFYICISTTSPNRPLTTCGSKQWTAYAYRVDSRIRNCVVLAWYYCERSVGTVFQLPNPDAIYSRDEEEREEGGAPSHVCVRARSTCC
jgi:hypothetical protein